MKNKATLDSKVEVIEDTMTQVIDGEAVMLSLTQNSYFGLDQIGTKIWNSLESGNSIKETAAILHKEFDAPLEQIEADAMNLVNELCDQGLAKLS